MKRLNKEEMMNITAGAEYSNSCMYGCGYTVTKTYWAWVPFAKLITQLQVDADIHDHNITCTANQVGW